MKLVLATRNLHKLQEIRRMRPDIEWAPLPDTLADPPETGATFEENAIQKARFVYEHTGLSALADDSGLEVDALGGRPGVHSRRYSPEATDAGNNALLLQELATVEDRRARYRCVLALVGDFGMATVSGSCEGQIGREPRGNGGFGYDPLFCPEATPGRTCAELSALEKDAVSHRGAAMRQVDRLLERL
jgi:XTP/dITP diphosphohydrolase